MSLIPWDKWFYPGIDKYKRRINALRNQYNMLRRTADKLHNRFQEELDTYKSMLAYDNALFLAATVSVMDDDQFAEYAKTVEQGTKQSPKAPMPEEVAKNISEAFGGYKAITGIYQLGKLAKTQFFSSASEELGENIAEDISSNVADSAALGMSDGAIAAGEGIGESVGEAVGEIAGEVAAEGAADAALASTGIGIVAAVGIDAIIGAIEGAKEEKELKKSCDQLEAAVSKIQIFINKVSKGLTQIGAGITEQEKRFQTVVKKLNQIQAAEFQWNFPTDVNHSGNYLASMR